MNLPTTRISSASNPRIKTLRSLERKKARSETGLFLVEGARLIEQALQAGWTVDTLVVSNTGAELNFVQDLVSRTAQTGADILQVPDRIAGSIARKDNPQSVMAAIQQKPFELSALNATHPGLWIGLYECRDPGNLGTILRTADCAGAAGVILIEQCCDPYSIEAVRASMGSLFDVDIAKASFSALEAWRRSASLKMIAASVNGEASHVETDFTQPSLILMGNEQKGLPNEIEVLCDKLCLIPMRGGADSLNLAQATTIMVYEGWRQRGFA